MSATPKYGTTTNDTLNESGSSVDEHNGGSTQRSVEDTGGSSVLGAVFNFTKSIVGAGVTGLGGAFASSGGIVSIICVVFFGILSKLSFDLLIELSIATMTPSDHPKASSYEDLGYAAGGSAGRTTVVWCKGLYTFGSMIAYMVIVKDNFSSAITHLLVPNNDQQQNAFYLLFFSDEIATTILMSTLVILPLCLLRDLKPLEKFSLIGILTILVVIAIVMYLYATTAPPANPNDIYVHWFQVRGGLVQSLGTFVFTFIAQHTVHLTYESLRSDIRDLNHWKLVSFISTLVSTIIALLSGLFVYMTFWSDAKSSMFALYPPSSMMDLAKILLTVMISLTYPLCLLACREIIIVSLMTTLTTTTNTATANATTTVQHYQTTQRLDEETTVLLPTNATTIVSRPSWLLPGQDSRQLTRGYHVLLTVSLWGITLVLALVAPSFGDVLNLVGCAMGTAIAFILPAVFSFLLLGYNHKAAFILAVGCPVGILGTYFSFLQLVTDAQASFVKHQGGA